MKSLLHLDKSINTRQCSYLARSESDSAPQMNCGRAALNYLASKVGGRIQGRVKDSGDADEENAANRNSGLARIPVGKMSTCRDNGLNSAALKVEILQQRGCSKEDAFMIVAMGQSTKR